MIIVYLQAGLSNQMFQYAAARRLAERINTKVILDISWFKNADQTDGVDSRRYELGNYKLPQLFYVPTIYTKLQRIIHGNITFSDFDDPYVFHKSFLKLRNYTILQGFFQNEKYFSDIRHILLNEFLLKNKPNLQNQQLLDTISKTNNSIAIHVRRGDYATSKKHKAHHGLMSLGYYKKAIEIISKNATNPTVFVFSNDIPWCRTNMKLGIKTVFVDNNDSITQGVEDMRLMQACHHQVIANSSFSWWAAWLNQNPSKIIIAPKTWLLNNDFDTSDVLPSTWTRI